MKQANIGHLKNQLSKYVDHVRDGGEVVIYDRDTAVARMVPLAPPSGGDADQERLAGLERKGLIRRGHQAAAASHPSNRTLAAVPGSVLADLLAERGTSL